MVNKTLKWTLYESIWQRIALILIFPDIEKCSQSLSESDLHMEYKKPYWPGSTQSHPVVCQDGSSNNTFLSSSGSCCCQRIYLQPSSTKKQPSKSSSCQERQASWKCQRRNWLYRLCHKSRYWALLYWENWISEFFKEGANPGVHPQEHWAVPLYLCYSV